MDSVLKRIVILVFILPFAFHVVAQNKGTLKKSDKTIFILGKKYYLHKVKLLLKILYC